MFVFFGLKDMESCSKVYIFEVFNADCNLDVVEISH